MCARVCDSGTAYKEHEENTKTLIFKIVFVYIHKITHMLTHVHESKYIGTQVCTN